MKLLFPPSAAVAIKPATHHVINSIFNDKELENIEKICSGLPVADGKIGGNASTDVSQRKCEIKWVSINESTEFLFYRMADVIRYVNAAVFDFDLYGFEGDIQYTVYKDDGNHYGWHTDQHPNEFGSPTKLTTVVQLSNESDYEGGDLELFFSAEPTKMPRKQGAVIVFPSYVLHRVTPVTKGTRKSLVCWTVGQRFK